MRQRKVYARGGDESDASLCQKRDYPLVMAEIGCLISTFDKGMVAFANLSGFVEE